MKRLVLITIGQSPREDVTPELIRPIYKKVEIIERGILDGYKKNDITSKFKPKPNSELYVTRLKDGSEVKISRDKVLKMMRQVIKEVAETNPDLIVILCSGEFPKYDINIPIIYPDRLLKGVVSSLILNLKAAVLIPSAEQIEYAKKRWGKFFKELEIYPISPYTNGLEKIEEIGKELKMKNVKLAIMDCIGYTLEQKNRLEKFLPNCMIINTRSILSKFLSEIF